MLNIIRDKENINLKVSIIIPCRNEEKHISECLNSLLDNSYPKDLIEIFVIDGMSKDSTREIIKEYIEKYSFIKLLNNPNKIVPTALNIGIKKARGDIIIRIDAHSIYPSNYIEKIVLWMKKSKADNVGGVSITKPGAETAIARAIALALSHPFGVGNSLFRIGIKNLKYVDTVPCGAYKREVFDKIGFFNENLVRNQDLEFNLRLKRFGGKILLVPDIIAYYYPKSNLVDFAKHNFRDAFWVIYPLKFNIKAFSWRHLIPLFFVLSLLGTLFLGIIFPFFSWLFLTIIILYNLMNLYFSARITAVRKDLKYLFLMLIVFAVRHIFYGLGSLWGLCKIIF